MPGAAVSVQGSNKLLRKRPRLGGAGSIRSGALVICWLLRLSGAGKIALLPVPGRMVCDSGMNVDIAVALFERGYTEVGDPGCAGTELRDVNPTAAFNQVCVVYFMTRVPQYPLSRRGSLLSQSYSEASVQEAIKSCSTLDEAWIVCP